MDRFFIIKPPPPSHFPPGYSYRSTSSGPSRETQDIEVERHAESSPQSQSSNDSEITTEIEDCIKILKAEKDVFKAENARLTEDIRKMNALRTKQAALEAEMAELVEGIHERHARIERPYRLALRRSRMMRKKAAQIGEHKWAELKAVEGIIETCVDVDEEGNVALAKGYEDNAEKGQLLEGYTTARSSFDILNAALSRLRQSRAELVDLGDLVGKVESIAVGDVRIHRDREKTPPARVRRDGRDRRNSYPFSSKDNGERRSRSEGPRSTPRMSHTNMALPPSRETALEKTQWAKSSRRDIMRSLSLER